MESPQSWAIMVRDLKKSFGNRIALRGIDLKLRRGCKLTIIGPNGSGKSTLLKVLSTVMRPSSGEVLIDGINLKNNAEEARARIGLVLHQSFLYGNLTAYENLEFYSRMYDVGRFRERIYEVADTVGITSRLHDQVHTLSRGMQQRLSIARALLHQPTILLLDEPEAGLDQQAVSMLWELLKAEGETRTIILTSHNLELGFEVCHRVAILHQGRIAFEGERNALDLMGLKRVYQERTALEHEILP